MRSHVDRPIVYIAGPYGSNPVANTRNAILVADRIQSTELLTAYVPHMNLLWDLVQTHTAEYWYDYDIAFLAVCDVLLRIPGDSPGADDEVKYAHEHGIPVFYDVESLLAWALDDE